MSRKSWWGKCSITKLAVFRWLHLTTSTNLIILRCLRDFKKWYYLFIFEGLTGNKTLTATFSLFFWFRPSKTWAYLPLPILWEIVYCSSSLDMMRATPKEGRWHRREWPLCLLFWDWLKSGDGLRFFIFWVPLDFSPFQIFKYHGYGWLIDLIKKAT